MVYFLTKSLDRYHFSGMPISKVTVDDRSIWTRFLFTYFNVIRTWMPSMWIATFFYERFNPFMVIGDLLDQEFFVFYVNPFIIGPSSFSVPQNEGVRELVRHPGLLRNISQLPPLCRPWEVLLVTQNSGESQDLEISGCKVFILTYSASIEFVFVLLKSLNFQSFL